MVRSFDYAARVAFPDDDDGTWPLFWRHWVSVAFLQAYLSAVDPALLPRDRDDLHLLLDTQLIERTLYELGHELTHRPDYVRIPLRELKKQLDARAP
jgi:maltose alpha-D-glucosyltransferase/alpha-amylase